MIDPRLDHDDQVFEIKLQDAVHPLDREQDAAEDRHGAARKPRTGPARVTGMRSRFANCMIAEISAALAGLTTTSGMMIMLARKGFVVRIVHHPLWLGVDQVMRTDDGGELCDDVRRDRVV